MKNYFLSLFLLSFITFSCSSTDESIQVVEQDPEPIPVQLASTTKDVAYGTDDQQTYDIYLPEGRTQNTTKTLIIIHGGSWVSGDKSDLDGFVTLAQNTLPDYAVVNLNYRLGNNNGSKAFPDQIEDIDAAINQLIDQREDLFITGNFALMGFSAGAHLSTLYDYSYDPDDKVKAVVNVVGPVDFTDPYYANNVGFQFLFNSLVDLSAFPAGIDPAVALSPAQQVSDKSSPTINFYGDQDTLVALSQLARLEAALSENEVPYESTIINGGHGNWNEAQYTMVQNKIVAFLNTHF